MRFNPLALFGLIGLFGVLGLLTGKTSWFWWFAWFAWFANYNKPTDERLFMNLAKTGLVCFAITMFGIMVLLFIKELGLPSNIIYRGIELVFTVPILSFTFLLKYFEDHGE